MSIYLIYYFRKSFNIDLKYFCGYLFSMFLMEIIAEYLIKIGKSNLIVYNILIFLEFNFLLFFLKSILESRGFKRYVYILIYVFNFIYICSSLYYLYTDFQKFNSIASVSGSFLITISLFFFYKEFLSSNKILNYNKTLSFWIAFGLLLYYLGSIPITLILNSITGISKEYVEYLLSIFPILVIAMYSCFIFGGLWSQKQVK
jgi:hypothetical protein